LNFLKNCPNCSTTLRFPASQGTVLVRCPVCSHRFQFNSEIDFDFTTEEKSIPSFQFNPSKQEYINLLKDLLYAPIDFLKSKIGPKESYQKSKITFWKSPKRIAEILLILILLLYIFRGNFESPSKEQIIENAEEQKSDPFQAPVEEDKPNLPIDPIEPSINI